MIHVTRHGQPAKSGDSDSAVERQHRALTPLGKRQATNLGKRLEALGFAGPTYVSPLRRCLETAEYVCRETDTTFEPEMSLIERMSSSWASDIELRFEDLAAAYDHCVDDRREGVDWRLPDLPEPRGSDGVIKEEPADVIGRIERFLRSDTVCDEDEILLVGHGATAGAIVDVLCDTGVDSELTGSAGFSLHYNATLTSIEPGDQPRLVRGNDTAHLGAGEITSNSTLIR